MTVCMNYFPNLGPIFGRHILAVNGPFIRHAIGIEDYNVVAMVTVSQPQQTFEARTYQMSLRDFANGWEIRVAQYPAVFNVFEVRNRAVSSLGLVDTYSFNISGDNLAYWCVTNQPLQPDSEIFGQHLSVERGIIEHHGIGIDGGLVAHINMTQGSVHIVSFDDFANGNNVKIINYGRSRFDLTQTRNRAINNLGFSEYDLFNNNCEHFAFWCTTGIQHSIQVENVQKVIQAGLTVAAFSALLYAVSHSTRLGE